MDDRTLLELAAKVVGYERPEYFETSYNEPAMWVIAPDYIGVWTPLSDDGDALRLAVKLRLSIEHNHPADQQRWVAADRNGCEGCYAPVSCVEDEFEESERQSATRRAIVRAAAAIALQEQS